MTSPRRFLRTRFASLSALNVPCLWVIAALLFSVRGAYAVTPTAISLAISSTSVPYKTPITLTATVTASGVPVTSGLVMFCDATAVFCENSSSLLGMVQLTTSGTAVVKIGSGPLGSHSYKAVYRANNIYASSTATPVTYSVQGTYQTITDLASSGTVGNYNLASTVTGIGAITSPGPSGSISFIDTSAGNSLLGTQPLGAPVLTNTFSQAPNSPFDIGDSLTSTPSMVIASTYLDGDNNIDVVTGDADSVISVLLGNGDGTFQPKVNHPGCPAGAGSEALKILLADFNRDGNADIILGCGNHTNVGTNGGISVLLGDGTGSFQAPVWTATGDLVGLAMGDFNNDGNLDIAVTNRSEMNVRVLLGNGNGTFSAPVTVAAFSQRVRNIVVADLDGDGNDDLIYGVAIGSGSTLANLYVMKGTGNGTFASPQVTVTEVGEFLAAGDINSDSRQDIISSTVTLLPRISNSMFVLIGNGDGTFMSKVSYIADIPSDPHLADVDGDGNMDIIAGGSYGALVYHGNGDGTFQNYDEPLIGGFLLTYAVNAGDYNNDGNADLVGTDAISTRAAVALSEVRQAADAVTLTGAAVFPLGSGIHDVDAVYSGDTIYISSTSSTVPLRAAPVSTSLSLATSPAATAFHGQSVTLTATLAPYSVTGPPATTTDTQTVDFYNGSTLIGTGTLSNGVATMTTTSLAVGSSALKATFPGTIDYTTSTSSTVNLTISNIGLASNPNPSNYTQSVTLTATVVSGATGTVEFFDGTTSLGTATIAGTTATVSTATLNAGTHNLTAIYSGDGSYASMTSPTVEQVVNKIAPVMSVASSGLNAYLSTVTITASLPTTASGSVTFTAGSLVLGTATISSGAASITTTALPVGNNTITASYGGDINYNSGTATAPRTVSKATPSSVLASSLNPSAYGSSVTFTDTLQPNTVTGTVTFTAGATSLGTVSVSSGVATLITDALPVGSSVIEATYNGDANYAGTTATLTQVVNKASPALALTSSVNPSISGQSTTLTVTLPAAVTGTVVFSESGVTLDTVAVTNGVATLAVSSLAVGTHNIAAQYSGDSNYQSASSSLSQVVNKANTTVALSSTLNPSNYGDSITLNAAVTSAGSLAPTGSITFSSGATTLGTIALSSGASSLSISTLAAGSPTITASYSGDNNSNTSSATLTQTINKITPALTLASSKNPASVGETVTLTATMDSSITGTVSFSEGATALGSATLAGGVGQVNVSSLSVGSHIVTATYNGDSNHTTKTATLTQVITRKTPTIAVTTSGPSTYGQSVIFTATLPTDVTGSVVFADGATTLGTGTIASGVATITTSALSVGAHTITASYGGDANNNSVSGTTSQTVGKASPSIALASSLNPSQANHLVTFTATMPGSVAGTVTFTEGPTTLGTVALTSGIASISTSSLTVGPHIISASYAGDADNNGASANLTQTVNQNATTITVTTSGPSTYGNAVTITSTVPVGATGTVTFTSGSTTIGTGTVNTATGTVSVNTSTLPVGTSTITANYSGDASYEAATGSTTQTVSKVTPAITVTTSGPSNYGEPVTVTTTLPPGTTGTVIFTSGAITIGTGTVNPSTGVTTITTTTLPVGSETITATYSGDTNNNTASASTTQTVGKTTPAVSLTSSLNPSIYGESVTLMAAVPSGASGSITFFEGVTSIGTVALTSGHASVTISTFIAGSHIITASYAGDSNYNNAMSSPLTQVVGKITPVLPPPAGSDASPNPNTPVTITAQIPSGVTGVLTFTNGSTVIGTAPIVGGSATITVPSLPVGSNPITVSVAETENYTSATSPATSVTVSRLAPTVALASSLNPAGYSQTITFTASVPAAATGTITFFDGAAAIGTGTVNGAGIATLTTSSLAIGTHSISAGYGGNANYTTASSPMLSQVVGKLPSTITLSVSSGTSYIQSSVVLTAIVATSVPTPTGTVTFLEGTTVLGTAALSSNGGVVGLQLTGNAALSISTLPAGPHSITAVYSGDASFFTSTSAPVATVIHDFTNKNTGDAGHELYPGDTAVYKFTLAPVGTSTFLGNVSLNVTGLPTNATYTVSPTSVSAGAGSTEVILTVKTSSTLKAATDRPASPGSRGASHIALALFGFLGLGAARRNRHRLPRLLMMLLLLGGSLLPLASLAGCAGGYYAPKPTSYTVTVTGTEGNLQRSATATLTVQQ